MNLQEREVIYSMTKQIKNRRDNYNYQNYKENVLALKKKEGALKKKEGAFLEI